MSENGVLKLQRKGKLWQVIRIVGRSRFKVTEPIAKRLASALLTEMKEDDEETRSAA